MNIFSSELQKKYENIKQVFLKSLPNKFVYLELLKNKLSEGVIGDNGLKELHCTIHGLSGSSKMLGLQEINKGAYELDVFLKKILNKKIELNENSVKKIAELLSRLEKTSLRLIEEGE